MKVALLNTLYAPYQVGGAERSVQLLAEGLVRRGLRVCVITLAEPQVERRSELNGVTVRRLALEPGSWWPYSYAPGTRAVRVAWHVRDSHNAAMAARVGEVLDEERPDVLHTHVMTGFSVAVWQQAVRRGVRVVHTLRDYYLMCPPGVMYRRTGNCPRTCLRCMAFAAHRRRASRAVHAVTGISRFILDRHVGAGFFERARAAQVIFNPLAAAQGAPARRREGPLVFGFIGRIGLEKGVPWLLEAFRAGAPPGARLVVAGQGAPGFVEPLKAKFASPAVSFIGQVAPAAFYEQVDVVVVPSLWNEPFGRTAIEPLAYGLPVVASNRGGLPEIVRHGVTGLVVDAADPASLGRAIGRLCADRWLVERLGRNARQGVSRFSQDSIAEAYARLYPAVEASA